MKNIRSFYIGSSNATGINCITKEEFLQRLSEEIDRVDESGEYMYFDVTIELNN